MIRTTSDVPVSFKVGQNVRFYQRSDSWMSGTVSQVVIGPGDPRIAQVSVEVDYGDEGKFWSDATELVIVG